MGIPSIDHETQLNRMTPTTSRVGLGTLLEEMIDQHNAVLAKLDADSGVNGTNYVSTLRVAQLGER